MTLAGALVRVCMVQVIVRAVVGMGTEGGLTQSRRKGGEDQGQKVEG